VEQNNSQELDKKLFSDLIYDPSAIQAEDSRALEKLVEKYPYAQLLRAFYASSLRKADSVDFERELSRAALFSTDGNILRSIVEDAGSLRSKKSMQSSASSMPAPEEVNARPADAAVAPDQLFEPDLSEPIETQELNVEYEQRADEADLADNTPDLSPEAEHAEEEVPFKPESRTDEAENKPDLTQEPEPIEQEASSDPDRPADEEEHVADPLVMESEHPAEEELDLDTGEHELAVSDELDDLIRQNVAPADYLKEEQISDHPTIDQTESIFRPETAVEAEPAPDTLSNEQQKVSKYDDDTMPYSFLWWLNKTRKEHSENYQPYVSFQLDTTQSIKRNTVDQLSSQIIENIFHLQSPVDQFENAPRTVPFQVKRKEDYILEKFLREEPQIKAPNSDKLDTENKARKSAEDPNDLVSETLAQIYTDQMLYHKAIDTYKKLSLKFPEKSTYFADQISDLEKKIN
jgi:hypothetical protein